MEELTPGEIELKIKDTLISQLDLDPAVISEVNSNTPLLGIGLGLDSVESLALVSELEKTFHIEVRDEEFTEDLFHSIGTLATFIQNKTMSQTPRGGAGR